MTNRVRIVPKVKRRRKREPALAPAPEAIPAKFNPIHGYLTRPLLKDRLLLNLSRRIQDDFHAISMPAAYDKGAILFVEGQDPQGVFIISHGRAKLTSSSASGKSMILRMAEPGEVVGLPGTVSGQAYALTAEALEPIQAEFVPRQPFLQFLREHGEAALRVAEIMTDIYHATFQEVRYLGFSASAPEKLARFLLDLTAARAADGGELRATLALTHEEIAEMIGAARETVSRLLADFKREGLIELRGSTLVISNKSGLEKLLSQ
jgi:CRP/FNR family transcriptional regulator